VSCGQEHPPSQESSGSLPKTGIAMKKKPKISGEFTVSPYILTALGESIFLPASIFAR